MAKDESKPKPPPEDPIQSALDAVESATGENLSDNNTPVSPQNTIKSRPEDRK